MKSVAHRRPSRRHRKWGLVLLAIILGTSPRGHAYSVQSHEQLVDLAWSSSIQPLLLARYPGLTQAQLNEAHAYAYGGCAIQDLGYYPFSHAFFSDLTHYVRSGDFVNNLLKDAQTPDELAFAIGALSHYVGDSDGHSEATNPSVAIEFPQLAARYGPSIAYDKNPHAHVRTEFAFDINEISKHRLAPAAYLEHYGLKVSGKLLGRAFAETYGLNAQQILGKRRAAVRSYRFSVRTLLPRVAYAEVLLHRKNMPPDQPGEVLDTLNRSLDETGFVVGWQAYRRHAGIGTYLLAGVIVVVPKVGPLSVLSIKGPTAGTDQLYHESINRTTQSFKASLSQISTGTFSLTNRDLDTGQPVKPGGYRLTDDTYAKLLAKITRHPENGIPLGLKQDIVAYYSDPNAPIATKKDPAAWAQVQAELVVVGRMTTRRPVVDADEADQATNKPDP